MSNLANRKILLGITGGIAAYKSAELVRLLGKAGAEVRVVMTPAAREFVQPLTYQALSGHRVYIDLFDAEADSAMDHIELARWCDLMLVAPASADFLGKLTAGYADNLLLTLCLANRQPLAVAPAMNQQMFANRRDRRKTCEQLEQHAACSSGARTRGRAGLRRRRSGPHAGTGAVARQSRSRIRSRAGCRASIC